MPHTFANCSDDLPEEMTSTDGEAGPSLAILECERTPQTGTTEWSGPCCEKCAAPTKSSIVTICRKCGWYASLGTFVELDPDWEGAMDTSASAEPVAQPSHLRVWLDLMPRWAWVIVASVFVVIVESVVARFATPADSSLRTTWSLCQLAIGILAIAGCHIFNFLTLAADDAEIGLLDLFLKPLKLWIRTCHNLPRRLWFVNAAVCGLVAAVLSLVVIGGIPYERLWDWGVEEPPKQNLMGAVMDRAKELDSRDGSDNLEDAINDFAGDKGADDVNASKAEAPKPQEKIDCVILGFQVDRDGKLSTLLLGAAHRSQLVFAGRVSPKLPDGELSDLLHELKAITTKQPFVTIAAEDATWVKPQLTCRVSFAEQQKDGRLRDPQWDKMLSSMSGR